MDGPLCLRCSGCGCRVDGRHGPWPWSCPQRRAGDDIDHVMVARLEGDWGPPVDPDSENPFVRYRRGLPSYHLWRSAGRDDPSFVGLVDDLDRRVAGVAGHGFAITPAAHFPTLSQAIGAQVWVKDETGNVGGSHKSRHLFGVLVLLAVLEALGRGPGRDLVIASCGNAAVAGALLAAATGRRLTAFVPLDAEANVVEALSGLGVVVERCGRDGSAGDPCYRRFRAAVADGAVPFSCQGPDNGAVIDGCATLAWEVAEQAPGIERVVVQVGGGALASAVARGTSGWERRPVFDTVQTAGAQPLGRAVAALGDLVASGLSVDEALAAAARQRSRFMWPWETPPVSVAHGILDDETYDWRAVAGAMLATGGTAVAVDETLLVEANQLARSATGINVDVTGSAGLAGLQWLARAGRIGSGERVLVLFTGTAGTAATAGLAPAP